jgi:putative oxidoreductase
MLSRKGRALDVVLWLLAFFLAWVFIRQGWAKFDDSSGWARAFRTWHFPEWFRVFIGLLETSAGLLVLWRRTAFLGAIIIVVVMLGAMATHVYWGHPEQVTSEVLPLFVATMLAFGRRKVFFPRLPKPVPATA